MKIRDFITWIVCMLFLGWLFVGCQKPTNRINNEWECINGNTTTVMLIDNDYISFTYYEDGEQINDKLEGVISNMDNDSFDCDLGNWDFQMSYFFDNNNLFIGSENNYTKYTKR